MKIALNRPGKHACSSIYPSISNLTESFDAVAILWCRNEQSNLSRLGVDYFHHNLTDVLALQVIVEKQGVGVLRGSSIVTIHFKAPL
jgi:hypothetical protein